MNDQDEYPHSHNRWLPWLLERGPCDAETAAEYVGRKLLSKEAFAQARKEIPASYHQLRSAISRGGHTS
jgi:hypothetical protein